MAAQWMIDEPECGPSCAARVLWRSRRNCSLTPGQLLQAFGVLSAVSLAVAAMCWISGARLVPPFTLLELLVFAGALFVYARHATDGERISVVQGELRVEWECAGHVEVTNFDPRQVRVTHDGRRGLIEISGAGARAQVGRYARAEQREKLARDLRRALLAV